MSDSKKTPGPVIKNNRMYDGLKYVAQILLPAVGTLYFGMAQAWGWTNGTEVVGTIVAVDTFLGVLLHISNLQYQSSGAKYSGTMEITQQKTGAMLYSMNLDGDPTDLKSQKEVTFKIDNKTDV